jgi:hypothetical protein
VAGLSPWRPGFGPESIHVSFMADKMALGQIFLLVLRFSHVSIIPPLFSIDIHHPEGTTVISETHLRPIDMNVDNM